MRSMIYKLFVGKDYCKSKEDEIDRFRDMPYYNKEVREKSLERLKDIEDGANLEILISHAANNRTDSYRYPEKNFSIIKCDDYYIGFNPFEDDPYNSHMKIIEKQEILKNPGFSELFNENKETNYLNGSCYNLYGKDGYEDYIRCSLNATIRHRIKLLLGIEYSLLRNNSFFICYFIFNGQFKENIKWDSIKFTFNRDDLDENLYENFVDDDLCSEFLLFGFENCLYFKYMLSECVFWADNDLKFDGEERSSSLKILDSIEDDTPMSLVKFDPLLYSSINILQELDNAASERGLGNKQFSSLSILNQNLTLLNLKVAEYSRINKSALNAYELIERSKYEDWFIVVDKHVIKLSSDTVLKISNNVYSNYEIVEQFKMDQKTRDRIRMILGIKSQSILFQNSEHIANYIHSGEWLSSQTEENGHIYNDSIKINDLPRSSAKYTFKDVFIECFNSDFKILINTFPSSIYPYNSEENSIYPFITTGLLNPKLHFYLDYNNNSAFNVLLIGPTGAGKSHLINALLNRRIVKSQASLKSVTKEFYFIKCQNKGRKELILTDTVGLCDTEYSEEELIAMIKGRINENFRSVDVVLIVLPMDRITSEKSKSIKFVLDWLNYEKYGKRFTFVITKSVNTNNEVKNLRKKELMDILKLSDVDIIFTEIPIYEGEYQDRDKILIKNSIKSLYDCMIRNRDCPQIEINFDNNNNNNNIARNNNAWCKIL